MKLTLGSNYCKITLFPLKKFATLFFLNKVYFYYISFFEIEMLISFNQK